MLLEQVREAESEQALDRLRLLRGEGKQRKVYILSFVPLNVRVDFAWSWKRYQDLVGIWKACNGEVPTKPKELMASTTHEVLTPPFRWWQQLVMPAGKPRRVG